MYSDFHNYWLSRTKQKNFQLEVKKLSFNLINNFCENETSYILTVIKYIINDTSMLSNYINKECIFYFIKNICFAISEYNDKIENLLTDESIESWEKFAKSAGNALTRFDKTFFLKIFELETLTEIIQNVIVEVIAHVNNKINPGWKLAVWSGYDSGCKNNIITPAVSLCLPMAYGLIADYIIAPENINKFEELGKSIFKIFIQNNTDLVSQIWDDQFYRNLSESIYNTLTEKETYKFTILLNNLIDEINSDYGNMKIIEILKDNYDEKEINDMLNSFNIPLDFLQSTDFSNFMENEISEFYAQNNE